ncbi:MAG: leucine-rich repeat domain-containing protein [Clostridia bacterium]|nr:leucine-rich repeat domain-containing protein [Clostridia bacterium]
MKKKIFLIALTVALFACALAISVGAKDIPTGYYDLEGNEIVVPTYDSEGDSLVWVRSTRLDRAEQNGIGLANGKKYYETNYEETTYYIFGIKTKKAIDIDKNYAFVFKSGIGISDNILVMNLDGITHSDGTGVKYFGSREGNMFKYVYIPASFVSLTNTGDNTQMFKDCSQLEIVEFETGSQITELKPIAFRGSALTEITLPEGLTYIDERAFDDCTSLKKVYIPRTVTFIDEIAFRGVTGAEYCFTGSQETTSGWEIADAIQYVNHCDVYYGSEHSEGGSICERCGIVIYCEDPTHNLDISITYESFLKEGIKSVKCLDCNSAPMESKVSALFESKGYSAPENGSGGIAIGFTLNGTAINEYTEITGNSLRYGLFAVLKDRLGENDIFSGNGDTAEGVISAEITSYAFSAFELKIIGFTDKQKDTKIAFGAYVAVTNDKGTTYSYLQNGTPEANEKYCFASFNDIVGTLNS